MRDQATNKAAIEGQALPSGTALVVFAVGSFIISVVSLVAGLILRSPGVGLAVYLTLWVIALLLACFLAGRRHG